ncbi:MAG: FAD-dependent oxidoreductase, partial [Streptosporangiaceae bacterium]
MTTTDAEVLIIGAGVIGLSTAICLAESGVSVAVAAAELPPQTTSVAAGALWGPHLVGMDDRIARWAEVTRARLADLSDNGHAAMVRVASGIAADRDEALVPPEFAAGQVTKCGPAEIPPGFKSAWRLAAPVVSMPNYLDYLQRRLGRAGSVTPFRSIFSSLSDAAHQHPSARVVVNCAGCGARDLVPDADVTPVRGQVVVTSNPGITEFFVGTGPAPDDLVYLFPHGDTVVLGGTAEAGNWNREPDPATAEQILAACIAVRPELRAATVLRHRVGLRPVRSSVRLEAERA